MHGSHCQHNLYICHCNPSSQDPSPIHPPSSNTSSTVTTTTDNNNMQQQQQHPVYVTQTSVAVMTSPTLNFSNKTSASLNSLINDDEDHETSGLMAGSANMTCNTLPRVIVSTNGNGRTVAAANSSAFNNGMTLFATNPSTATLRRDREGGVTLTSHAALINPVATGNTNGSGNVDKYLECFWPQNVANLPTTNGHSQMATVSGNLAEGQTLSRVTRYREQQQHQHQQQHQSISSVLLQPPRTCLEKVVFALLSLVLIIIFLVAALVFLYLGSGHGGGLDGVYDGGGGLSGGGRAATVHESGSADASAAGMNVEDGIDIVRIKTTEEVIPPASLGSDPSRLTLSHPRTVVRTKKVCVTPECSRLSRRLLSSVDPDRDPCHSFYAFACGGWMARNQPPPRRMVHSAASQARDEVDKRLRDLIESIDLSRPAADVEASSDRQLRIFYDSCMATDEIRAKGSTPAVHFLHSNFSKFIIHGSDGDEGIISSEARRDLLTELILQLLLVNGTPLLDVSLDLDPRDPSRYLGVVRVPQRSAMLPRLLRTRVGMAVFNKWVRQKRRTKRSSRLGMSFEDQLNIVPRQEIFKSFQTALNAQRVNGLVKTAETMGVLDPSSERAKQADMDEILGFLAALERILPSEKQLKRDLMANAVYNEFSVEKLQNSFRFINWHSLLDGLFPRPVTSEQVFLVHDPVYLRKLGRIIALFEPRVIWKSLLVLYAKDVLADLVTVHMHSGQNRWQYCTQVSSMLFGEALSRLYLRSVPASTRDKILRDTESIFSSVRAKVLEGVESSSFLHPETRAASAEKIAALRGDFVGSDIYFNRSLIKDRYNGERVMSPSDFFGNVLSMFCHFRDNVYHLADSPVDPQVYAWNLVAFPFTVNAFHLQQLNSIVIPLGVILDAHYSLNVPKYLNVASLGTTLAHEILHSLDSTGREFAASGVLSRWWDQSSESGYDNATRCLRKQYPQHFRRPLRIDKRSIYVEVDGDFTLSENACDVDGLGAAELALLDMDNDAAGNVEGREVEDRLVHLPNNPYSPRQLFYINAAQSYCSHLGPVSYVLYLELDEHSPNPERVDGLMMNSELFSSVFQCPLGSRMNPEKKCRVWT